MGPEHALVDLAFVFAVLFAAAAIARLLSQSVVPFYILAGVALQPLVRDPQEIGVFALIGVAVLLFVIGLEFSLSALARGAGPLVSAGLLDVALNFGIGLACGLVLGLPWLATLAFAGAFYVSSSVIVAKSIIDHRLAANAETPSALGVIVFEDLFIAFFLAVFAGVAGSGGPDAAPLAAGLAKTVLFVVGLLVLARVLRRPLGSLLERIEDELLVVFLFFWLIALAAAAQTLSVSVAVGGFLAGVIVAGTKAKPRVERIIVPYQQLFAALFFVAFGLMVDLDALREVWAAGLGIAVLGLTGKLVTGWAIGRSRGVGGPARLRLGLLLAPRGEFSIVVAGVAVALAVPGTERLPALVAVYVFVLSVAGPILLTQSDALVRTFRRTR
ncbi:MAG: cation:proton antiporter [Gemmatimonadota bacterium]